LRARSEAYDQANDLNWMMESSHAADLFGLMAIAYEEPGGQRGLVRALGSVLKKVPTLGWGSKWIRRRKQTKYHISDVG
jgi:hypothetical protein